MPLEVSRLEKYMEWSVSRHMAASMMWHTVEYMEEYMEEYTLAKGGRPSPNKPSMLRVLYRWTRYKRASLDLIWARTEATAACTEGVHGIQYDRLELSKSKLL